MTEDDLNADFDRRFVVETEQMPWQRSPSPSVWRKRLDRLGGAENGRVTSIVRYDPGAGFPPHEHPRGEEILVLEGTFSDERGDFTAGTYMLNPEGFAHGPSSAPGCVLFVKLQQYAGRREAVLVDTNAEHWSETPSTGVESLLLYASPDHPERMHLLRFSAGATMPETVLPQGSEIYVIEGRLEDEHGTYSKGTWLRLPRGHEHSPRSATGCLLYAKVGGFPRRDRG